MKRSIILVLVTSCGSPRSEAAPSPRAPTIEVTPVAATDICFTKGALGDPTMRAFALAAGGDAAQLTFTYRGETEESRELASGQLRRQLGLKLRAQDGCNVVYVMWRLDPTPKLDVSIKFNPGKHTHQDCGADGYTKIKPHRKTYVPAFEYGATHKLRAEIVGDELYAWIDGALLWQGRVPETARAIAGPSGIRSDNVKFDLVELAAPPATTTTPTCNREGGD